VEFRAVLNGWLWAASNTAELCAKLRNARVGSRLNARKTEHFNGMSNADHMNGYVWIVKRQGGAGVTAKGKE